MAEWIPVMEADSNETVYVYGFECTGCGYVAAAKHDTCPRCGRTMEEKDGADKD